VQDGLVRSICNQFKFGEAKGLAALTGKNIYSPYYSWDALTTTNANDAKGRATYAKPDGNYGSDVVKFNSYKNSREVLQYLDVPGDRYTLSNRRWTGNTGVVYYSQYENYRRPAYRACTVSIP